MKKIISLILLSSCLGAPLSYAMDTVSTHPTTAPFGINITAYDSYKGTLLKGFDSVDYSTVTLYCQKFAEIEKEQMDFKDSSMVEPMDFLIPLATQALNYVGSLLENHPHLKVLNAEINLRIKSEEVTPLWISLLGLRIQAAISKVSSDEFDLFKHVIDPGHAILKGLTTKDAWKSYEKSALLINNFRGQTNSIYSIAYPSELSCEVGDEILETLEKMLPPPVYYPLYNKGIIGIPFLVHSFIHNIYPLALSKTPGHAHGIDLSQLGFGTHDYLHAELDSRRRALEQFVLHEVAIQLKAGDIELKSTPLILDYAVRRFNLLNEGLSSLFNAHLIQLHLSKDTAAFKRAMGGYNWILHEKVVLNSNIYKTNNFNDVLRLMCDMALETTTPPTASTNDVAEFDYFSWESPHEFIATFPLNGETIETDREIGIKAMEYLKSGKHPTYPYINKENFSFYIDDNAPCSVEISPRFIDVSITGKNAHKYQLSFPTLFHKWANMDDNLGLLRYAGVNLKKPHLDALNTRNARGTAMVMLETTEKELDKMVTDFLNNSLTLTLVEKVYEDSNSIVHDYQAKAEKLENEYREKLKGLPHHSKE